MAKENRKHRRGPGDIRFVPYDPNQKPERSWRWRWWVGGGLGLIVSMGVGLWGLRRRDPPSPVVEVPVPAAVVTDTNVTTATPEEPVVPDLPFAPTSGLATGEEAESTACHGRVRILANAPDYAQAFLSNTAKRVRFDTNHWITARTLPYIFTNAVCGDMGVWLEADGFKADALSRRAVIQEGRTSDVAFLLTPLPATLLLACDVKDAVAQIGNVKFAVTNVFSVASLQPVRVTVTAAGSPAQALDLGPYEPLTTNRHVVAFKRAAGAVRIEATVPTNAAAFFQGLEKRIRISSNDWKTVTSLPYVADGLPCAELPVDLVVTGFQTAGTAPRSVRVIDAQTNVVLFRLEPLPATLTIMCDVTGAVIQIENRQSASDDPVPVPSLKALDLSVIATGYVTQVVKLGPMEPGKAYRKEVKLEPIRSSFLSDVSRNSLGMEFVEVPGLTCRFSKYETRVKDYEVFAKETNREWPKPDFEQGPDHPAVMVSWNDAKAFCAWLTEREKKAGRIKANEAYRLPTDAEWSVAVGLKESKEGTPKEKDEKIEGVYPWGTQWPPPKGAGNQGNALRVDNYVNTSPVGAFTASEYGLYDMGGNVEEWCEDYYGGVSGYRVLRGADWLDGHPKRRLSSARGSNPPVRRDGGSGFRVVLGVSSAEVPKPAAVARAGEPMTVDLGDGVQLALVGVTAGRFMMGTENGGEDEKPVHEVRITRDYWMGTVEVTQQQYEQVMGKNPSTWKGNNLPIESVSWSDATAFCVALTERERRAGRLPEGVVYRLPTEAEWEYAARGGQKSRGTTYSGGNDMGVVGWHKGNSDSQTHPVGEKMANELGLLDMSGNVWEWCYDWYDSNYYERSSEIDPCGPSSGSVRVNRGGSWDSGTAYNRMANRNYSDPWYMHVALGFRVVLSAPILSITPHRDGTP